MNLLKPKIAALLNSIILILVGIIGYYYNSTSITSNLFNIKQNLNIFGNLFINQNINSKTLQIYNAFLHKKNAYSHKRVLTF